MHRAFSKSNLFFPLEFASLPCSRLIRGGEADFLLAVRES